MPGASPSLGEQDAADRLGYIQQRLLRGASRSRVWAYSWGAAYGGLVTAQTLRAATTTEYTTRMESIVSAASASLGLGSLVLMPPAILADSVRLDARIARLAAGDDQCSVLRDAESYLVRDADNQAFGIGWVMQSVNIAYDVALGLTFGFWLHDWQGAAITIGTGIAVSELMMLTQPTDAIDALRRYRIGDLRPTTAPSTSYWIIAPDIAPDRAGLILRGAF
jgi:hypothetical protein